MSYLDPMQPRKNPLSYLVTTPCFITAGFITAGFLLHVLSLHILSIHVLPFHIAQNPKRRKIKKNKKSVKNKWLLNRLNCEPTSQRGIRRCMHRRAPNLQDVMGALNTTIVIPCGKVS